MLVIVSLSYKPREYYYHHRDKLFMLYSKTIFPMFDKCIEIMNGKCNEKNKMIDIKTMNSNSNNHNRGSTTSIMQIAFNYQKRSDDIFCSYKINCQVRCRTVMSIWVQL